MSKTIYSRFPNSEWMVPLKVVAAVNSHKIECKQADKDLEVKFTAQQYPLLVCDEGEVFGAYPVLQYLAHGHPTLYGTNDFERAKIDQWVHWASTEPGHAMWTAAMAIFGTKETTAEDFNECSKKIKEYAKILNTNIKGDWLVGDNCTIADYYVAALFMSAMQTMLDAGFGKAMAKFSAWFKRVVELPEFIKVAGRVRQCQKAIKPQLKAVEKKVVPKAEKPKPKSDEAGDDEAPAKKPKNPLDALPETKFDLFNFKTFYCNHEDKAGAGVDEFLEMYDSEGWSCWYLEYEMFGKEGTVDWQTSNLLNGFIQRFESFGKYSFGRACMLGTETKQDIIAVFMWRGLGIPQECIDHPSFEYYKRRQLDMKNVDDVKLIREFWSAIPGRECMGKPVLESKWQK